MIGSRAAYSKDNSGNVAFDLVDVIDDKHLQQITILLFCLGFLANLLHNSQIIAA